MGTDIHLGVEFLVLDTSHPAPGTLLPSPASYWERVFPPEWYVKERMERTATEPVTPPVSVPLVDRAAWLEDRNQREARRLRGRWFETRSYALFEELVPGVRYSTHGPVGRGLPADLSFGLRACTLLSDAGDEGDLWLGDHSQSWALLSELVTDNRPIELTMTSATSWEEIHSEFARMLRILTKLAPDKDTSRVRLVFGFDS